MIVVNNQDILATWLCSRVRLHPSSNFRCIGRLNSDGRIVGVVGYENFTGSSVVMHVAGEPGWLNREFLWTMFHYPFVQCNLKVAFVQINTANKVSLRFAEHIGFKRECLLKDVFEDGDGHILSMRAEDCKYLTRKTHGKVH